MMASVPYPKPRMADYLAVVEWEVGFAASRRTSSRTRVMVI